MALTATQQAQELIRRSHRILVATRTLPTVDTIASAVSMALFLKKQNKTCDVVIPGYDEKTCPAFLKGACDIKAKMGALRALHLTIDVKDIPLGELMYDVKDGTLEVIVVPKEKEWTPKHVEIKHGADRYDLVIALDCPDMKSLGAIHDEHADFLYRTDIINADHSAGNEHWGQVNIVNMNAVSTTETLYELMHEWNNNLIDEAIATSLLAGMIAKTRSFRTPNVTPKTLATSSQLIAMGARREDIVTGLWRTKSVGTLNLWGKALSRLHEEPEAGLVWTVLGHKDFLEAGVQDGTLDEVIDELIAYVPEAKVTALIYESPEREGGICVTIASHGSASAHELGRAVGAAGTKERAKACLMNTTLVDAVNQTIGGLKKQLETSRSSLK